MGTTYMLFLISLLGYERIINTEWKHNKQNSLSYFSDMWYVFRSRKKDYFKGKFKKLRMDTVSKEQMWAQSTAFILLPHSIIDLNHHI